MCKSDHDKLHDQGQQSDLCLHHYHDNLIEYRIDHRYDPNQSHKPRSIIKVTKAKEPPPPPPPKFIVKIITSK